MQTRSYNVYKFDELTKDQQAKAIENCGIYEKLRDSYEYLVSDEAIIETIKANDYDFTINGKID